MLPWWQRWKPTYRVAQVTVVHTSPDSLDIVVYDAFSSRQGLLINQDGTPGKAYKPPISGWQQFAQENPNDPLVDNIFTSPVTLTPAMLAQLRAVNEEINSHNSYKLDIDQYGRLEQWAYMTPGGSDDCEDFALTKAKRLQELGWPVDALRLEIGTAPNGQGHCWLTVATDKGNLSLDNNYKDVIPGSQMNYTETATLEAGSWGLGGIVRTEVPVVYLN